MKPGRNPQTTARPWRTPSLLALSTLAGLLVALTGGGPPWRAIAWALLAAPLIVGWVASRR